MKRAAVCDSAQTPLTGAPTVPSGNRPNLQRLEHTMLKNRHTLAAAVAAAALLVMTASGCAVTRGQETVGAYIDDSAITAAVKSRLFDNRVVDGTSVSVETLNGTVMLSGFAKSAAERSTAESVTRQVTGVRAVRNELAVRP